MLFTNLPPEVHILIFKLAYRPYESKTNLLLVDKYFYELASPLLYNVVYLSTRRRVVAFHDALASNPRLATHVRHILISDRNRDDFHPTLPDFIVYWPQTYSERLIRRQRIRDWLLDREKELNTFRISLRFILSLTSTRLQSLTLLHYEHSIRSLQDILNLDYPILEELTIRGDYPPFPKNLQLPNLKRLHLAAGDMPNPWASFTSISNGCPNLTHLRITEPLSCILSGSVLAQAFEVTFGLKEYDPEVLAMPLERNPDGTTFSAPAPQLPPKLQELRLQPYPPEISTSGTPYPDHVEMVSRLQSLEAYNKTFKLIPSKEDNYVLPYSFDVAKRQWKDRITGGYGCWGKSNSG